MRVSANEIQLNRSKGFSTGEFQLETTSFKINLNTFTHFHKFSDKQKHWARKPNLTNLSAFGNEVNSCEYFQQNTLFPSFMDWFRFLLDSVGETLAPVQTSCKCTRSFQSISSRLCTVYTRFSPGLNCNSSGGVIPNTDHLSWITALASNGLAFCYSCHGTDAKASCFEHLQQTPRNRNRV